MTGKDFFGRLLTNKEKEEFPPRDRRASAPPDRSTDRDVAERNEGRDSRDERTGRPQSSSYLAQPDLPAASGRDGPERSGEWDDDSTPEPVPEPPRFDVPRDATEDVEEPACDPGERASRYEVPGGDGLSTDLPSIAPARDEPETSPPDARPVPPETPSKQVSDTPVSSQATHDFEAPENRAARPSPPPENLAARPSTPPDARAGLDSATPSQSPTADRAAPPRHPATPTPETSHRPLPEAPSVQPDPAEAPPEAPRVQPDPAEAPPEAPPVQPDRADVPPEASPRLDPGDDRPTGEAGDTPSGSTSTGASQSDDVAGIRDRVVLRLLDKRIATAEQVKKAIQNREREGLKATLWRILAHDPTVDREKVYREAALTYAFAERSLDDDDIDLEFVRQVADVFPEKKRNRLIELRIVPVGYEFEQQTQMLRVVFITHDPSLPAVRELMQDLNLERYELQYADESKVKDLLFRAFPKKNEYLERMSHDPLAYDLGTSYEAEKNELIDEEALEAEINRSSLINLFEAALVEAVHRGASDIHIYPNARRQVEIHFRVDGRLSTWHVEDKVHPESLLAVIKDNTMNVDRFERDMAQDGFIQRKVDDALIRYRVSILPIATASNNLHAESIVIRVLDDRKVITDLSKLGLLEGAIERFDTAIRQPHGMVILTGPTGSGKSTTLVAALHQVVTPEVNVLTVEDPVEYIIPGVRQIKLNHKLGLEGAIRAILRHDPDVVMVGEMRDRATAELAVKLANTGHLTFSTLHTNDAPSAVSRLYKMGVEPFLIAYAINLVVAQRLLRNLCPACKVVDNDPDPVLLERLGFSEQDLHDHVIYKTSGDPTCKTCKGVGYKGRRAISEAMYFSREIRHMIVEADQRIDEDGLREKARSQGMLTLQDSAREVVKMGETSVDEMMRVTMTEE